MPNSQLSQNSGCLSQTVNIRWEHELPISIRFNDVYFSRTSGIDETRHVFLKHNRLEQRFNEMRPGSKFTVGETGFGTGLNFLCTWQLFLENAPDNSSLIFISTEKFPLQAETIKKALGPFKELSQLAYKMLQDYNPCANMINLHFLDASSHKNIRLQVLVGDVLETLSTINQPIDAWFFDGFSPTKNPDMWQQELFYTIKAKSSPTATYATYTAARMVRDRLTKAGFSVIKKPGFAKKRDMIAGNLISSTAVPLSKPWFVHVAHKNPDNTALIVGGGLAGCSTAWSLARRGWQVSILEKHSVLANEASGNPQGVIYTKLAKDNNTLNQFILNGYQFTLDALKLLKIKQWNHNGVIHLATDTKTEQRYQALDLQHPDSILRYLSAAELGKIAGLDIQYPGLIYPQAGWINPPEFCHALADHPNITVKNSTIVHTIEPYKTGWRVKTNTDEFISKTIIFAQGISSHQLSYLNYLPLKFIRGQITQVKATAESQKLTGCVCAQGYIASAYNGFHTMGATFSFKDNRTNISQSDHQENLTMLARYFPAMYEALGGIKTHITGGRVGFRCSTPDYLPVVGPVVDFKHFVKTYAPLRHNSQLYIDELPKYSDGIYVTTGHGAKGIITCPISGEILAMMITGEDQEKNEWIPTKIQEAIHPSRFLIRDLIRNKI